jgi:hypothetical protein
MTTLSEFEDPIPPKFRVVGDNAFMETVSAKTLPDGSLHRRLQQAQGDTRTCLNSEDDKGTQSVLRKLGLLVVPISQQDESSSSLDRYVCANLLDYHNTHPGTAQSPDIRFHLNIIHGDDSCSIRLPGRSKLILQHIAQQLSINIFIFTNRSKPVAFLTQGSIRSIGFYNCVDSYKGENKYYVLESNPKAPVPRPAAAKLPKPPDPSDPSGPSNPSHEPSKCAVLRQSRRVQENRRNLKRLSTEESRQIMKKAW